MAHIIVMSIGKRDNKLGLGKQCWKFFSFQWHVMLITTVLHTHTVIGPHIHTAYSQISSVFYSVVIGKSNKQQTHFDFNIRRLIYTFIVGRANTNVYSVLYTVHDARTHTPTPHNPRCYAFYSIYTKYFLRFVPVVRRSFSVTLCSSASQFLVFVPYVKNEFRSKPAKMFKLHRVQVNCALLLQRKCVYSNA